LFSEQFEFRKNTLINFVGGGGKTALIHRLMDECNAEGTVLYTTTTRIHPPKPTEGLVVISSDNLSLLKMMVERVGSSCPSRSYKLVVTRHFMAPDLLQGVPPDFDNNLDRQMFPILLNEADGSARYSIKLPREGEPVLMQNADYLVPVIGIDCLNQPLGPKVVFRFQNFADRFSLRAGELMTPEMAAEILMHKSGVCKDWKAGTTIIPFINKVDEPARDAAATELATAILNNGNFPVKRVVFGSVLRGRVSSIRLP
jgi:probable selenium-dependent hydroxylase accessory protein YqeC